MGLLIKTLKFVLLSLTCFFALVSNAGITYDGVDVRQLTDQEIPTYSSAMAHVCCENEKEFSKFPLIYDLVVMLKIRMKIGSEIKIWDKSKKMYATVTCDKGNRGVCYDPFVVAGIKGGAKGMELWYYCKKEPRNVVSDYYNAHIGVGVMKGQVKVDHVSSQPVACMSSEVAETDGVTEKSRKKGKRKRAEAPKKSTKYDEDHYADSGEAGNL